jgi:hypothetical protein
MSVLQAGIGSGRQVTQFPRDVFKVSVADAKFAQVLHSVAHVILTWAKAAFSLFYKLEDVIVGQLTRILGMPTVDDEGQGLNGFVPIAQAHRLHNLDIDIRELFPLAEVRKRFVPERRIDLEHHAAAGTATVETKDEPWLRWCTAVLMRVDAETAMETMERSGRTAQERKPGIPHQRSVTKHPGVPMPRHCAFP